MSSVQTHGLNDVYKILDIFAKGKKNSLVKTETDLLKLYPMLGKNKFSLATEINLICNSQGHK